MDFLALFGALLEIGGSPGGRVTVKERYEMKKRVRELRKREEKSRTVNRPTRTTNEGLPPNSPLQRTWTRSHVCLVSRSSRRAEAVSWER